MANLQKRRPTAEKVEAVMSALGVNKPGSKAYKAVTRGGSSFPELDDMLEEMDPSDLPHYIDDVISEVADEAGTDSPQWRRLRGIIRASGDKRAIKLINQIGTDPGGRGETLRGPNTPPKGKSVPFLRD